MLTIDPTRAPTTRVPGQSPPPFTVVIDSREQLPLAFGNWPTAFAALRSGDYSIAGYEDRIAIERKSLPDLFACVGRERERFERELERLASLDYAALVIEAPLERLLRGYQRSQVPGRTVVGSLLAWSVEYRLPVFAVRGRRMAAAVVRKLLVKWFKYRVAEPGKLRGRSNL